MRPTVLKQEYFVLLQDEDSNTDNEQIVLVGQVCNNVRMPAILIEVSRGFPQ
jgi:hypothetical protein